MADKKGTINAANSGSKKISSEAILNKVKSEKIGKHLAVALLLKPDLKKKK